MTFSCITATTLTTYSTKTNIQYIRGLKHTGCRPNK